MLNKRFSKRTTKAVAVVMRDLGFVVTKISKTIGVHRTTVYRYSKQPLPDDLQHFATEIKSMFLVKQQVLLAQCFAQLEPLITDQSDLRSLVMAIKVLSDSINNVDVSPLEFKKDVTQTEQVSTEEFTRRIDVLHDAIHHTGRFAGDPAIDALLPQQLD